MSERKQPQSYKELIEILAQLIRDDEPKTKVELDERIRDMGYEPAQVVAEMRARLNQALDQSPLNWRNKQSQLEQAKTDLQNTNIPLQRTRAEKEARLQQLIRKHESRGAALAFRNLHELSDDDLDHYLAQAEYLDAQQTRKDDSAPDKE